MGLSFSRFCLRARLAVAAHKLATTDLSTEDIATQMGFVDASHLHRAFARHYHCTPAVYRRRARSLEGGWDRA
jgi:AraC family transcriptional regulator